MGGFALLAGAVVLSLFVGSNPIPLNEVFGALFGGVDSDNATVITSHRLPRTVLGVVSGVALGCAGALMQGHTRSPLAEPGLFGVSAGASFGVVLLVFTLGVTAPWAVGVAALADACVVTVLVFALGGGNRSVSSPVSLALAGAAMAALLASLTSAIVLLDKQSLDVLWFWTVGSLSVRPGDLMPLISVMILAGVILATVNAPTVSLLGLGSDVAQALGKSVRTARIVGIAAITLLTAAATAACGPIGFLGLVVPHVARLFCGADYRRLIPLAGVLGACILLLADVAGRVMIPQGELPVGLVLSLVGAPAIIYIVRKRRVAKL